MHVVSVDGLIIESTINAGNSLTGESIIDTYLGDHIHPADVLIYLERLERTIDTKHGLEFCTFRMEGKLWLAKMERISSLRIRVTEFCIDDMSLEEILHLL